VRERVRNLSEDEKKEASRQITEAVKILESFRKAGSVMCYASLKTEVDTFPLMRLVLEKNKRLWLPWSEPSAHVILPVEVTDLEKDLSKGVYGILSPAEPEEKVTCRDFAPDVVFVPGTAFDKEGNRLGRGLGYFDRFLSRLKPGVQKIGLAFECQMEETVPVEEFDVKLDRVIWA
jgi:5-formyltetrahydrofolate cyclo-ligase